MGFTVSTIQNDVSPSVNHVEDEVCHCLTGAAALQLVSAAEFQQQWDTLYEACPWATVFQGRPYVTAWLSVFGQKYLPIVVFQKTGDQLTGLLVLALKYNDSKIVVAGHGEADSQTWLSEPAISNSFISKAFRLVTGQFPNKNIMFWNLAPDTPLGWATQDPFWKQKCVLQPLSRSIIRMSQHSHSKRERRRIKQLQEIGHFEVIKDRCLFVELLDELTIRHDFRHGAMFNKMPFAKEPCNKELLLALFDAGLLHLAVFFSAGEIVAAVAATVGKNRAHLGAIIFHSPKHAHLSPGIVHFLLTIDYFKSIGLEYFDLTPGGDAYKERLATDHDTVHLLKIAHNSVQYHRKQLKNYIDEKLMRYGFRPIAVELMVRKKLYLLHEHGLGLLTNYIWKHKAPAQHTPPIKLNLAAHAANATPAMPNVNSYRDLLSYKTTKGCLSKWEFLEEAMHRFEDGQQVYTWSNVGKLRCCMWAKPVHKPSSEQEVHLTSAPQAYLLGGIYCHAHSLPFFWDFVQAVYLHLVQDSRSIELYLDVGSSPRPVRQNLLALHATAPN